jgi:hypothetical protein
MINLLDYILDLFRDESHAQAFVANPGQALADAGLSTVSTAQLQSVAATAIPSLAMAGSGDGVTDLQQAVSSYHGFQPQPDFSSSADLASNNSVMSPTTNITDDHSVSFGVGDITLGDKTTAQGDGAVAGDVLSTHDGTVIQTSGHGTTTSVHGDQTVTDLHGTGNTSAVDDSQHDSSVHSSSIVDTSVHDSSVHDASVHDSSVHDTSVHDTSLHDNSIHETTHTGTGLDAHLGF